MIQSVGCFRLTGHLKESSVAEDTCSPRLEVEQSGEPHLFVIPCNFPHTRQPCDTRVPLCVGRVLV